jgi:hypothetical protein
MFIRMQFYKQVKEKEKKDMQKRMRPLKTRYYAKLHIGLEKKEKNLI